MDALKKIFDNPLVRYLASMVGVLSVPQLFVAVWVPEVQQPLFKRFAFIASLCVIFIILAIAITTVWRTKNQKTQDERMLGLIQQVLNAEDATTAGSKRPFSSKELWRLMQEMQHRLDEMRRFSSVVRGDSAYNRLTERLAALEHAVAERDVALVGQLAAQLTVLEKSLASRNPGFEQIHQELAAIHKRLNIEEVERAYSSLGLRYGLAYKHLTVSQTISLYGAVAIERKMTIVTGESDVDEITQSLNITLGKDETPSTIGRDRLAADATGYKVEVAAIVPLKGGWYVKLHFEPAIPRRTEVELTMTERLPDGSLKVGLTKAEFEAKEIKNQFSAWRIDSPTLHYHSELHFPRGFKPKGIEPIVAYQPLPEDVRQARQHPGARQEAERNIHLVERGDGLYSVIIDVEQPLLGMMYLIRWDPLACD